MEETLKLLFDYQRFEQNKELDRMIHETESRYTAELMDDDLSLINAAGDKVITQKLSVGSGGAGDSGAVMKN